MWAPSHTADASDYEIEGSGEGCLARFRARQSHKRDIACLLDTMTGRLDNAMERWRSRPDVNVSDRSAMGLMAAPSGTEDSESRRQVCERGDAGLETNIDNA